MSSDTTTPITNFADLGYDTDAALQVLVDLGVIDSITDIDENTEPISLSELESLALMGNLVMLDAISDKSTDIEEELADYQVEVDKLSGMQETLTGLYENVDTDGAKLEDLFDFVTTDNNFISEVDTTRIEINYDIEANSFLGVQAQSFETLDEYIALLNDTASDDLENLILAERLNLFFDAVAGNVRDVTDASFISTSGGVTGTRQFIDGDGFLVLGNDNADYRVALTYEDFRDYLIALRLQEAGFIGEDVFIHPVAFAQTNPGASSVLSTPATDDTPAVTIGALAEFYVLFTNVYWGKVTLTSDTTNNLLSVDYNGTAGLSEMGIFLAEYSENRSNGTGSSDPFPDEESTRYWLQSLRYAEETLGIDNDFSQGQNLTGGEFKGSDIDILLEAVGTAIESQSTTTEVKLLTVNSSITEWGELNDVWDLIHEYIHDALKRASDNSL